MKKRNLLILPLTLAFALSIFYRVRMSNLDQAIITHGVRTVDRWRTFSALSEVAVIVIALMFIIFLIVDKIKTKKAKSTKCCNEEVEMEISNIINELESVAQKTENSTIRQNARFTIEQIEDINKYINRFDNLYTGDSIEVLAKLSKSLKLAKVELIQNAKSIVNRINIEGCENEITNRVSKNHKIIEDVKVLLNETVNYLDNKTTKSSNPLESITSSLRILNDTLGEEI